MIQPKGLNSKSREFHKWVTKNGYGQFMGVSRGGHLKYRLRNGDVCFFSSTPSAYSAIANAQSEVRKRLGIKSESPRSRKSKKSKTYQGYNGKSQQSNMDGYPPGVQHWLQRIKKVDEQIQDVEYFGDFYRIAQLEEDRKHYEYNLSKFGVIAP